MADSSEEIFDGDDVPDSGSSPKKRGGGLGNLLPAILKFTAIGIGAMIFIVTVVIITVNIMNKGGKSQTVLYDDGSPYVGTRPEYSYFDMIGSITTRTRDFPVSATVTVEMIIGYDLNDQTASAELTSRRHQIRDFLLFYFANKRAEELTPDRVDDLRKEIREQLNQRLLDKAKVRVILFNRLDVLSEGI